MPGKKKKKVTLTKAISSPTKRYSPRQISEFKNKENQQATKARLKIRALRQKGQTASHLVFNNKLSNPTITVKADPKPKTLKEKTLAMKREKVKKTVKLRVTPGLPLTSKNKTGKGIKGQQTRQVLAYQRATHARIISDELPKSGYVSPGKGGYPSHSWKTPPKRIPAIRSRNAAVKRRRNG